MPDIPTPPPSASRRDRKAQAAPGLVAATQVRNSRVPGAVVAGVRGGWLIAGGIAVAVVVALSGTIVATGFGGPTTAISAEAQDLRAGDLADDPCTQAAAGEAGGSVHRISTCEHIGDTPTIQDDVAQTSEAGAVPTPRATPGPGASDRFRPGQTAPNTPSAPAPGGPNTPAPAPGDPGPSNPGPSNPGPTVPAPGPAPVPAPPSAPVAPPAPVHVPKSLAFTGLTQQSTISLLGIKLLSSYTLSLSGEPGSTATVWYGSSRAGSVTFNSNGRASIKMGGALIGGGLGNPIIRAEYSDGTTGNSVQAPRNSI